jgi:general secretion pathway protein G
MQTRQWLGAMFLSFVLPLLALAVEEDDAAKVKTARADLARLAAAMNVLFADCGELPTDQQGLSSLVADPGFKGWNGPYIKGSVPLDPWKNPYRYKLGNANFTLRSAGKDGKFGTSDDVGP